jgi:hypothetical protein
MGHDRVFGIDWHDHTREIGWDRAIEFAQEHGQRHLIGSILETLEHTEETRAQDAAGVRQMSVIDQLRELDDPDALVASHRIYLDMSRIGEDANYVGADVILRWYERNMKMFVNLARLVESPEERVLVNVGAGHVPLLAHFLVGAGFRVESVLDYLGE